MSVSVTDFGFNELLDISAGVFSYQSQLTVANLNNNQITYIAPSAFTGTSMQELYLQSNLLTELSVAVFNGISNLLVLDVSNNRLDALPALPLHHWANPASYRRVFFFNNNITRIPAAWSDIWSFQSGSSTLTTQVVGDNNPSTCGYVHDLDNIVSTTSVQPWKIVCQCASGYVGLTFCESMEDSFIPIPSVVSDNSGYKLVHPRISGGVLATSFTTNYQNIQTKVASVSLSTGGSMNLFFPTIRSVFFLDGQKTRQEDAGGNNCITCTQRAVKQIVVASKIGESLPVHDLSVTPNDWVPTNFVYSLTAGPSAVPSGLFVQGTTPRIQGQADQGFRGDVNITITDTITGESKMATVVKLSIADCGNGTCKNNGTCSDTSGDYFDNIYTCACASGFTGGRCESLLVTQTLGSSTSSSDGATYTGTAVAVVAVALLAVLLFVWRRRKHRLAMTKVFHVFISYRVAEDAALANSLYDQLQGKTWTDDEGNQHVMEVFLDSRRLELAENWKDSFMYALNHSCLVVPIVSEACLKPMKMLTPESKPDNVLVEWDAALQAADDERLFVLPILVGNRAASPALAAAPQEFNFRDFGAHNFDHVSLPYLTYRSKSLRDIVNGILEQQAVFLRSYPAPDSNDDLLCTAPKSGTVKVAAVDTDKTTVGLVVTGVLQRVWSELEADRYWSGSGSSQDDGHARMRTRNGTAAAADSSQVSAGMELELATVREEVCGDGDMGDAGGAGGEDALELGDLQIAEPLRLDATLPTPTIPGATDDSPSSSDRFGFDGGTAAGGMRSLPAQAGLLIDADDE